MSAAEEASRRIGRRRRRALLAAVVLAPLAWWGWKALVDPEVELLPPGDGGWVVDGRWRIDKRSPELFPPTLYRLRVAVVAAPRSLPVEITAMRDFRLAVDGRPVLDTAAVVRRWKRPLRVDLAPWLGGGRGVDPGRRPKRHEILIEVRDRSGPTPLRVAGRFPGGPPLATGEAPWEAAVGGRGWAPAVGAGGGEAEYRDKPMPWRRPGAYRALLAAAVALAAAGLLRRPPFPGSGVELGAPGRGGVAARAAAKPAGTAAAATATGVGEGRRPGGALRRHALPLAVLAVVSAAHLWNAWQFPFRRSHLDLGGHLEHIRTNARTWRPPLAGEGWQMYQPPLYYWAAGALYRSAGGGAEAAGGETAAASAAAAERRAIRRVQKLGGWVGVAHAGLAYLLLLRFGPPGPRARAWALAAVGLAPAALTTGAMITNEPFAGLACGLPAAVGAWLLARGRPGLGAGLLLGALAGLALLAKFTGLMPLAALAVGLGAALVAPAAGGAPAAARRRRLAALAGLLVAAAAIAGPYYLRNVRVYGRPFVGNWDPVSGQDYEQEPGYRTLGFYARFGEVFAHLPERARWSSLWDGLYASTWGEIHGNFVGQRDPRAARRTLALFALAVVPTAAALWGLGAAGARAGGGRPAPGSHPDAELVLVAVTVFSLAAVAVFTMVVPFRSAVKGFFLLHLAAPAAVFAARGYERMERGLGRGRWALDLAALAQIGLTSSLFLWR